MSCNLLIQVTDTQNLQIKESVISSDQFAESIGLNPSAPFFQNICIHKH